MHADAASMQAVQLTGWGRPAVLREVLRPHAGPGEVLLEVRAAGLCHSDLHLMHWPAGTLPYELPFTLGHEVAGTVAALGPGTEGVELGESVIVYGPGGCGRCKRRASTWWRRSRKPAAVRRRPATDCAPAC